MRKIIIPMICIISTIICCIKINIINTKALSPLGNSEANFQLVSKEFGEDFSEFIKDKSPVKIYVNDGGSGEAKIKILNQELRLTKDNIFLKGVEPVFNYFEEKISNITNSSDKKTNTNTEKNNSGQDLDNIINELNNGSNNNNNQ